MLPGRIAVLLIVLHFDLCFSQVPFNYEQKEAWFDLAVGRENTGLINGIEYFIPFQGFNTNPFFGSLKSTDEILEIDEKKYHNVSLLYDTYNDVLVLRTKDKSNLFAMVKLDKQRIQSFTLQGHFFKKMNNPLLQGKSKDGFYDILYKGKNFSFLCKRSKKEFMDDQQPKYELADKYFLLHDNRWAKFSGFKDFYGLTGVQKKEIALFIKSQKIKARKMIEKDMVAVASFCDSRVESLTKK
jgi:hypothetical protein